MISRKARALPVPLGHGTQRAYEIRNGVRKLTDVVRANYGSFTGNQVTDSEDHPGWRNLSAMSDVGGDFSTQLNTAEIHANNLSFSAPVVDLGGGLKRQVVFTGDVVPVDPRSVPRPSVGFSSASKLDQLGATAISRCAPSSPTVNLAASLAEALRDGLPSFSSDAFTKGVSKAKAAGDDFLNVEFGWLPLVGDLSKVINSMSLANDLVRQYERDAGLVVRRQYHFPPVRSTTSQNLSGQWWLISPDDSDFYQEVAFNSTVNRVRVTETRQWFSGAFTYYLPWDYESPKSMRTLTSKLQHMLTFSLTPQSVWDLSPWTWVADWFSNAGEVIDNLDRIGSGSLVVRYGYMMETTIITDTYTRIDPHVFGKGLRDISVDGSVTLKQVTKLRRRANPFGFGVTWGGLSPLQLSIAAALGISRGGR